MCTFIIKTLGCKVNQYESAAIAQRLKETGFKPSVDQDHADVCIIDTCTVTQKAAMQSRQIIRRLIRSNPASRIVVTGCYAQIDREELIQKVDGIDEIIDNTHKQDIPALLFSETDRPDIRPRMLSGDIRRERRFKRIPMTVLGERTRPLLKIQDGCNSACSYCIVPHARGTSRSMPVEEVIRNIEILQQEGFHEIVLTGIHLGNYGKDLMPEARLSDTLKLILANASTMRIRLSSIEPRDLTDDIIQLVMDGHRPSARICPHFHIPLQSGDNGILSKMRRPYTRSFFRNLILKIHQHLPEAAIGVDTLIGFPGESNAAFENTYALIAELPVTYLHVFPFSPRAGTPAFSYPRHISQDIIKERCRRMRHLAETKKEMFYRKFLGTRMEILVESKKHKKTGLLKGLTPNYIPVLIDGDNALVNKLVEVKIDRIEGKSFVFGTPTRHANGRR